jgi:hypothetical protein
MKGRVGFQAAAEKTRAEGGPELVQHKSHGHHGRGLRTSVPSAPLSRQFQRRYAGMPKETRAIIRPILSGVADKDYKCIAAAAQMIGMAKFCPNRTVKHHDEDHRFDFSHATELNADLLAWLEDLELERLSSDLGHALT